MHRKEENSNEAHYAEHLLTRKYPCNLNHHPVPTNGFYSAILPTILLHETTKPTHNSVPDIQILDSAKVSKEGFLAHRELYSYQLKNYLEDNQLQQNSTCMIYFSENRKKLEKEATKILNKYKKNNRMTVSRIDSDKFRFTKPEE